MNRSFGREAFGDDPENYHSARPPYPGQLWETLRDQAGLRAGMDILEIGAGTGLATGTLLTYRPNRMVAIEPDPRLASFLRSHLLDPALEVLVEPFESADLPTASFDFIANATSFHWLDAADALRRARDLLKPGGVVAIWWNAFGDHNRSDPFHDATSFLFAAHRESPSSGDSGRPPYALDAERRLQELTETGFHADSPHIWTWTLTLDPIGVKNLYRTYSNITILPLVERESLLGSLFDIAATEFEGRVDRNMTTVLYMGFKAESPPIQ